MKRESTLPRPERGQVVTLHKRSGRYVVLQYYHRSLMVLLARADEHGERARLSRGFYASAMQVRKVYPKKEDK